MSTLFQALFFEDEEGHTGPFLKLLRNQEEEERETYLNDISNQLEGMEEVSRPIHRLCLEYALCIMTEAKREGGPAPLDSIFLN